MAVKNNGFVKWASNRYNNFRFSLGCSWFLRLAYLCSFPGPPQSITNLCPDVVMLSFTSLETFFPFVHVHPVNHVKDGYAFTLYGLVLTSFSKIRVDTYTSYALWSAVRVHPINGGKDHNAFHPLTGYNGFSKSWCTGHDRTAPLICRLLYRPEMFHTWTLANDRRMNRSLV